MSHNNKTILIADDHEDMLFMLSDTLKKDYGIVCARNGAEGLALLEEHSVTLVISDVMMPEMNGFEFCEKIKSNYEFSHIPVILLTAKNTLQSKIEGLDVGADVYVEKPFSMEFLVAQIKSLLMNRDRLKSYFIKSPTAQITSMASNDIDKSFLETLEHHIYENMSNTNLDVPLLARRMNMSRTSLYRKINSLSDLSPAEIINLTRLKKAIEIISTKNMRLNEVIDAVGYNSVTQLGRNFQKHFGMTPSEYIKKTYRSS